MDGENKLAKIEKELAIWRAGVKHGVWMYAHWKNGTQYVGSSGKTLKRAMAEIDAGKEDGMKCETNQ